MLDPFRRIASACRSFRRVSGWLLVLATVPWSALAQISPPTLADGTLNVAYAPVPFAASGATTWSWAPQAGWILPPGLSLNVAGVLAGTPTRGGNFAFRVTANLSAGGSLVQDFTLNVTSPPVTVTSGPTLPVAVIGQAYAAQLTASGGSPFPAPVASYLWLLYDGTPPTGLSLGPDGRITGTPAASVPPGPQADFQVAACDFTYPVPQCGSRAIGIVVDTPMVIGNAPMQPDGVRGTPYPSVAFTVSGGTGPFTWAATGGTLPAGMALDPSGVLTGTPTGTGTFGYTLTVTDAYGVSASKAFTSSIYDPLAIASSASLPTAEQGVPYGFAFARTGGKAGFEWAVAAGALPPELTLASAGGLTGTPIANGTFGFSVGVTDSLAQHATQTVSIEVVPPLSITTASLPGGTVGTAYSQPLATTGGQSPLTWSIAAGSLPPGVSLTGGVISGTPTAAGSFTFTARAVDALGGVATSTLVQNVVPPPAIVPAAFAAAAFVGTPYTVNFATTGMVPPYVFSMPAPSIPPPGMSLSASGSFTGTPTASGSYTFDIRVVDGASATVAGSYTLLVDPAMTITTVSPLPAGFLTVPYNQSLAVAGGTAPFTWTLTASTLPTGLTLSSAGTIGGTPTAAGGFDFTAQVTDTLGQSVTRSMSIPVALPLTVTTLAATSVTATTAVLNAAVNANGYGTSALGIRYAIDPSTVDGGGGAVAPVAPMLASGSDPTAVSAGLTGLTPNTTYYFRASATNASGTVGGSTLSFVTLPPVPTVIAIAPTGGPAAGGTLVTITGTDLGGATAVRFGEASAPGFAVDSPTRITATAPAGSAGTVDVSVTTPGGTGTGAGLFTYAGVATTFSGPTATGSGTASAAMAGGGADCTFTAAGFFSAAPGSDRAPPNVPAKPLAFPHGLFGFVASYCTVGAEVTLTMTYPAPLPAHAEYWKYGPTIGNESPHWYRIPVTISGNTATFTVVDGGLGDDDLAVDGTIVDQGGIALVLAATGVPALGTWGLLLLSLLLLGAFAGGVRRTLGR